MVSTTLFEARLGASIPCINMYAEGLTTLTLEDQLNAPGLEELLIIVFLLLYGAIPYGIC